MTKPRPTPHRRADYPHAQPMTTRWIDNDAYGHINNIVYYAFFDTVVNTWLIERGACSSGAAPRTPSRNSVMSVTSSAHTEWGMGQVCHCTR